MSFKGYASSRKINGTPVEFATVEPVAPEQFGLTTRARIFMRSLGPATAGAGSGLSVVDLPAHQAVRGDTVAFTSGANAGRESVVIMTTPSTLVLADELAVSSGDEFILLRHKSPLVDDEGNVKLSIGAEPIRFRRDGVNTEVSEDTATPGNSRPLPTRALDEAGEYLPMATEAKQDAQVNVLANLLAELAQKADVTDTQPVAVQSLPAGLATSANQVALGAKLDTLNAKDFATSAKQDAAATALAALLTEAQKKANLADTQPVDVKASVLPTGAATAARQDTLAGKIDTLNLKDFATAAKQDALKTVLDSLNTKTPEHTAKAIGLAKALQTSPLGNAPADSARNDYAAAQVGTGAWVQLIASSALEAQGLLLFDSSGQTLELGFGAPGAEARALIIPPGGLNGFIPLRVPASTRVSVRAISAPANVGELDLTLLG